METLTEGGGIVIKSIIEQVTNSSGFANNRYSQES